jgi:spermidine/putrescine transport system substrate-binding protein
MQPAFKAGDIWIAYSWQDGYVNMKAEGLAVEFMEPSQGKLGWVCGFMLGANTKNYRHAHKYVESFINHESCIDLTNLFYYGSSDVTVKPSDVENKALAKKLNIGDPQALNGPGVNIQSWMPNEDEVALAWEEVSAA